MEVLSHERQNRSDKLSRAQTKIHPTIPHKGAQMFWTRYRTPAHAYTCNLVTVWCYAMSVKIDGTQKAPFLNGGAPFLLRTEESALLFCAFSWAFTLARTNNPPRGFAPRGTRKLKTEAAFSRLALWKKLSRTSRVVVHRATSRSFLSVLINQFHVLVYDSVYNPIVITLNPCDKQRNSSGLISKL